MQVKGRGSFYDRWFGGGTPTEPRWDPDDPRWLTLEPDIQPVDLQVLRQAGIPEPLLYLAMRRARSAAQPVHRLESMVGGGSPSLAFLDEVVEDPDKRPYTWDLPDDCI